MIYTFAIEYNHDWRDKSERFRASVDDLLSTGIFASTPTVVSTPVFSYRRVGRQHLDAMAETIGDSEAIVFLSEVCMHSYLLIQNGHEATDRLNPFAAYNSLESFRNDAVVCGYCVGPEEAQLLRDDSLVISSIPQTFLDEEADEPNPSIVEVVQRLDGGYRSRFDYCGPEYAYRIKNPSEHNQYAMSFDLPFYVLGDERIDLDVALKHCRAETLREHLHALQIPFGTFNDNHMDDLYTVSYRGQFWQKDEDQLAFTA